MSKPCSNCGAECQDYTTYWSRPRFRAFLDGERLVFPRYYICSKCQEAPFTEKKQLKDVTVSDILGEPLHERKTEWYLIHAPGGRRR